MNFDYTADQKLSEATEEQQADLRFRGHLLAALRETLELTDEGQAQHRSALDSALRAVERRLALRAIDLRSLEDAAHLLPAGELLPA